MVTLFLIGNLASGKSTAARYLASHGARRIDLDQLAKDLYVPGSDIVIALADAFGSEILNEHGGICAKALAERAFATQETVRMLNDIVLPAVYERLKDLLQTYASSPSEHASPQLTVVEVSLAREFAYAFPLADEIMAVTTPCEVRLARAVARGMSRCDAERRIALQPSEEELMALATCVIDNSAADDTLFEQLDAWCSAHGFARDPMTQEPSHEY